MRCGRAKRAITVLHNHFYRRSWTLLCVVGIVAFSTYSTPLRPLGTSEMSIESGVLEKINKCFRKGEYIRTNTSQPYFPTDTWQNACARRGQAYTHWKWKPAHRSCEGLIDRLEQAELCRVPLAQRSNRVLRILFVGDSMSFQMYSSLALLSSDAIHISEADQRHRTGSTSVSLCDQKIVLTYVRNDYLTVDACKYCLNFWQFVPNHDVIVFNRGAHVLDNESTHRQMVNFSTILASSAQKQRLIWRTTAVGHPDCENQTEPTVLETRTSVSTPSTQEYKWAAIKEQNDVMLNILANHSLRYEVLDAYTMSIDRRDRHHGKRADGKVDCLHYCLPGVPDTWSRALIMSLSNEG